MWAAGLVLLVLGAMAIFAHVAVARATDPPPSAQATQKAAPAPGGVETAAQPSTDQYRLSRERYEKAIAYSRADYMLYFLSTAWSLLVLILLLRMGVVAKLRDIAERLSGNRGLQACIFVPGLLLMLTVLHLPIRMYWHVLSLRYEQSVQRWGSWFWDWTKGELIGIVMGILVGLAVISLIRWKPQKWWLYFWFGAVPVALFLFFISPWFLDPLFNKFLPLQEKHAALVESIGKLTQRAGVLIPPERMFLMEASVKTNEINAYVTGIGASKRVVIWDTSIQKTKPEELLFIVGHELGHYVLGHVWKGFVFFLSGALVGLFVAYSALQWVLGRWGEQWGVRGQGDWATLAVLLLIMNVLDFAGTPIGNGFSRVQEHEADVYGLEVIHGLVPNSQEVAASAFQVLGDVDLADPNPSRFITIWLYSHPPLGERLKFAHSYDPWSKGEAPKFVK